MKIGAKVVALRKQLNMKQTTLAQKAGLANSTVCDIEKDRYLPSVRTLEKLANALGVTLAELLSEDITSTFQPTGTEGK